MTLPVKAVGNTNVSVTSLSLGGASFGNLGAIMTDADVISVMQYAWQAGIRYFDTAPHYGRGLSEQRMGHFLQAKARDEYVISSKVGRLLYPGDQLYAADGFVNPLPNAVRYDYSADGIKESFEGSCDRLSTSRIDIVFVHDIGDYTHGTTEGARHLDDLMGSGMGALRDLKQAGRVGAIGIGVNETQVCIDVMNETTLDVILLAGRFTLLDRSAETGLLDICKEQGTSLVLGGIFNSGILATGPTAGAQFDYAPASQDVMDRTATLKDRSNAVGLTLAQAAVQFAVNQPVACSVLLGTSKVSSLQRNLDAVTLSLSDQAMAFVTN